MRSSALLLPAALAAVLATALAGACTTADKAPAGPAATAKRAVDCEGASFALPEGDVVGTLDGKPITYGDLGKEVADAEKKALFEYCDAVYAARSQALDAVVTDRLVEKAAAAAGKSPDEWMAAEMAKRAPPPTDEEIKAFFDEAVQGRPDAPPFEAVKQQAAMALHRDRSEKAIRALVSEMRSGAAFTASLPDVRSPPREVDVPAHTATKGQKGAKVRVVEFADFECPYCSQAAASVRELEKKYGDKVEFAYRHFPLRSIHPNAQRAAEVSQCAAEQGKFWEMHDKLYADQRALDEESMKKSAAEVGVDVTKLDACLTSGKGKADVDADFAKASELGVGGTPTFFINGRQHTGSASADALAAAIDDALKTAR